MSMNTKHIIDTISDFLFISNPPEPSDIIFIPGSGYGALAKHAANLWHQGYAPFILPSGRFAKHVGFFTGSSDETFSVSIPSPSTEAQYMESILLDCHVPKSSIYIEEQATFTYENAIFSRKLTDAKNLNIKKAIIVCQAFHARRCLMYYQLLYPETQFFICPVNTQNITKTTWHLNDTSIDRVLAEMERCGQQFHDILKSNRNN